MDAEGDDRPRQAPPGLFAWGMTAACLIAPVLGAVFGYYGVTDGGDDVVVVPFAIGFGLLVLASVLSVVVHLWGMVWAFYPRVSVAWVSVCLLGIAGGVLTLAAGIFVLLRLYGAA